MPQVNPRGRRGRGRHKTTRPSRPAGSATSKTDAEVESQQQQSSNRNLSADERTDDERLTQKGPAPPVPQRLTRSKQGLSDAQCEIEDDKTDNVETRDSLTMLRDDGTLSFRRLSRGSQGQCLEQSEIDIDVESKGENLVSDSEESRKDLDKDSLKLRKTSPFSIAEPDRKSRMAVEEPQPSDFDFPTFKDQHGVLRAKRATYVMPICIGSIAFWQGKKAPEKTCYQWMVYVRSPANVDLSHVISTVRFKLHPSFNKPEKDVTSPPYQLEKSGWGEFDIGVEIKFHEDSKANSIESVHFLKLLTTSEPSIRRPVVSEKYEEIVFSEPPAKFFKRVRNQKDKPSPAYSSRFSEYFPRYESHLVDDCKHRIDLVRSRIRNEVRALLAKAEANGIEIDIREAKRLIEEATIKSKTSSVPILPVIKEEKRSLPERSGKMRIIIDGDDPNMPLKIESELGNKRSLQEVIQKEASGGSRKVARGKSNDQESRMDIEREAALLKVSPEGDGGVDVINMEIDRSSDMVERPVVGTELSTADVPVSDHRSGMDKELSKMTDQEEDKQASTKSNGTESSTSSSDNESDLEKMEEDDDL